MQGGPEGPNSPAGTRRRVAVYGLQKQKSKTEAGPHLPTVAKFFINNTKSSSCPVATGNGDSAQQCMP